MLYSIIGAITAHPGLNPAGNYSLQHIYDAKYTLDIAPVHRGPFRASGTDWGLYYRSFDTLGDMWIGADRSRERFTVTSPWVDAKQHFVIERDVFKLADPSASTSPVLWPVDDAIWDIEYGKISRLYAPCGLPVFDTSGYDVNPANYPYLANAVVDVQFEIEVKLDSPEKPTLHPKMHRLVILQWESVHAVADSG